MAFLVQRALPILMLLLGCGASVLAQGPRGPKPVENKTLENLLHEHAEATPVGTVSRPQSSSTEPAITAAWERYEKVTRAASAGLLQQIEKDLQRARPLSDGNATAGLEASKKAFVEHGSLPSTLNTGLRNARREVETAYRDASRMLHEQYETTAAALRKASHEEDADALMQEWALLHNMLELAQGTQLDSTWKHSIANGQSLEITLYSNGTINAPDGPDTWSLKGTTLVIRWQNPEAPGGAWVDTCDVAEHGGTYLGTNQLGTPISGVRLP
jgi:hypothetical protein